MPNTSKPWNQDRSIKPVDAAHRFSSAPTLDGWEVIDTDGRSVTDSYVSEAHADKVADRLNLAASAGKKRLARVLGALDVDDSEDAWMFMDEPLETLSR